MPLGHGRCSCAVPCAPSHGLPCAHPLDRLGSRGKERDLRDKFPRSGKFPGSSGRTLTRKAWRGCIRVARRRVLHVPGLCRQHRFPPRASMRRAATTRSEALRGGKRGRRQSTRVPHGALSVGRWAGCAWGRGCKGRNAPCRLGGCREQAARAGSLPGTRNAPNLHQEHTSDTPHSVCYALSGRRATRPLVGNNKAPFASEGGFCVGDAEGIALTPFRRECTSTIRRECRR